MKYVILKGKKQQPKMQFSYWETLGDAREPTHCTEWTLLRERIKYLSALYQICSIPNIP